MTKANECTCPSGDGSLRHPCPAHPAVEQAGGDERAAFEAAASKLGIYTCNFERYTEETAAHENRINARVEDPVRAGDYRSATLQDCWKVWQEARAALAQPSTAPELELPQSCGPMPDIDLSQYNLADVEGLQRWAFAATDELTAFDRIVGELRTEIAMLRSYESEWELLLNQHEQERDSALAEVERLRESKGDPSGSFDRCMRMMYERDENAKRLDAALARVAELTATRNRYGLDAHYFNKNLQRILRDFGSFTPDELARALIILAKVADEKVVAQAQHSVPDGWRLVPIEPTPEMLDARRDCEDGIDGYLVEDTEYYFPDRSAVRNFLACVYHGMLAAAPGKEGV